MAGTGEADLQVAGGRINRQGCKPGSTDQVERAAQIIIGLLPVDMHLISAGKAAHLPVLRLVENDHQAREAIMFARDHFRRGGQQRGAKQHQPKA